MDLGDSRRKEYSIDELKELMKNSTDVVNWYPYSEVDGATVRGPWGRWFRVNQTPYGEENVASPFDDAKYAAAAMNALPTLVEQIETCHKIILDLSKEVDGGKVLEIVLKHSLN